MSQVYVLNKFEPNPYTGLEIDTTSRGKNKDLSPFYLGPVPTYIPGRTAENVENLWQFSKVYSGYERYNLAPFFIWRDKGWANPRAQRYPMGKGAKPLFSYWDGQQLDYVTARKVIYIPAYADAVIKTQSYKLLYYTMVSEQNVVLRDFDGYDYIKMGMTLKEVANNPSKTMGHAFVLAMLLTGTIKECMEV